MICNREILCEGDGSLTLLVRWLTPPVFPDEEQTRLANLLHWILLALLVVNVFDMAILLIFAPETLPTFWINGVFLAFTLISFWMMRSGKVRGGGFVVCMTFWALLVGYLAVSGGVTSPAFGLFAVIIIVSAVLLGVRGALGFGLLCIGSAAVLYWFGNNGWLTSIEQAPTPERLFATQITIFFILMLLMAISGRSVWAALTRARTGERTLAERNRQLQGEIAQRQRVQQEQARLVAILETTSDLVGIADTQTKLLYLNHAGRRLVGMADDADVTATVVANYHPAPSAELILNEAIPTAIRDGTWSGETVLLTRGGGEIPVSQVIIAHRGVDGNVEYLSTIMRDISERKQAEQQRLKLALEQEQHAAFKEFLGTISHDLKTPMTIINTSLDLLKRLDDPQRRDEKIRNIQGEITLLQKYIEDLMLLTRLDRVPDLTFDALDLNALLSEVQMHVTPAAEEKGIDLHFSLDVQLPPILADQRDIYRAMTNLIENAIHYTTAGGSVSVTTRSDEADVIVDVADTGIGIDPTEVAHVFERFYRSKHAQQMRSGGTGLGLAIIKRIVEVHAGKIEVESTLGVGTTFRVRLPLAPS